MSNLLSAGFQPAPAVKNAQKGIYVISDFSEGKAYIGATNDKVARFINHKNDLKHNRHHNQPLQDAVNNSHKLELLFIPVTEETDPFEVEKALIDEYKHTGLLYNLKAGMGERKHSPESIEKMRLAKLGKVLSQEHRENISKGNLGKNTGLKRTDEQIALYKERRKEQARAVMVDGIKFASVHEAAAAYGTNTGTASSRFKSATEQFKNWQYLDESVK